MFLCGSPSAAGLAGILFHFRRRDQTPLAKIDRLAISIAICAVLLLGCAMLSMYLKTRKLERAMRDRAALLERVPSIPVLTPSSAMEKANGKSLQLL